MEIVLENSEENICFETARINTKFDKESKQYQMVAATCTDCAEKID